MKPNVWKALAMLASVGAAVAVRNAASSVWKQTTGHEPPANPDDPDTDWTEAIAWTLVTGALVGVARLVAQRSAARVWEKAQGGRPPE